MNAITSQMKPRFNSVKLAAQPLQAMLKLEEALKNCGIRSEEHTSEFQSH